MSSPAKRIEEALRPEKGWWGPIHGLAIRAVAISLLTHGYSEEEARELMGGLIEMIREEYGD